MLCFGGVLSFIRICKAVVVLSVGYRVMWPWLLTEAISAAIMSPYLPPITVAFSLESGSETTATPEVNATYLRHVRTLNCIIVQL